MNMIYKPDCQKWKVLRQHLGATNARNHGEGFLWLWENNVRWRGSRYLDLQVTVRSQEILKCFPHFLLYILCQISCKWNHKPSYCWNPFWRKGDLVTFPYEHLITQFLLVQQEAERQHWKWTMIRLQCQMPALFQNGNQTESLRQP